MLKPQRRKRLEFLRDHGFLYREALQLSKLPKKTPALQAVIATRDQFVERFNRKADRMGWDDRDYVAEYRIALKKLYKNSNWLVQEGAKGKQQRMKPDSPNPWAMYRDFQRNHPDPPDYRARYPKERKHKQTLLDVAQIFVQSARKKEKQGQPVSDSTIGQWVAQLEEGIKHARGERKKQLERQKERLEGMLEEGAGA